MTTGMQNSMRGNIFLPNVFNYVSKSTGKCVIWERWANYGAPVPTRLGNYFPCWLPKVFPGCWYDGADSVGEDSFRGIVVVLVHVLNKVCQILRWTESDVTYEMFWESTHRPATECWGCDFPCPGTRGCLQSGMKQGATDAVRGLQLFRHEWIVDNNLR